MKIKLSPNTIRDLIVWVLPTVAIPLIRYQAETREDRSFLLMRDFLSYGLGTAAFFVGQRQAVRLLKKTAIKHKELLATAIGTSISILLATKGLVRLTDKLEASVGSSSSGMSPASLGRSESQSILPKMPQSPPPQSPRRSVGTPVSRPLASSYYGAYFRI